MSPDDAALTADADADASEVDASDVDGGDPGSDPRGEVDPDEDMHPSGSANGCGGAAALRYNGAQHAPGDRCGCTGTLICASPDALRCADDAPTNVCGGCAILPASPGTACGPCGGGVWECDGGELECSGAAALNLCGGCGELDGPPGAPCEGPVGQRWECTSADAVACRAPSATNACGGAGVLEFEGLDALPGESCEAACGEGRLLCDPDSLALRCDGPAANPCGGCDALAGAIGDPCGCDLQGRWICDGGAAFCDGGIPNACGGCGALTAEPGRECAGGGVRTCVSDDTTACTVLGAGSNYCGGDIELRSLPGSPCGSCGSGTYACADPDSVVCAGDRGSRAFNACGGCEALSGVVGGACGACGSGEYVCEGDDDLGCEGDVGDAAFNACFGCEPLSHEPNTACGVCATWQCVDGGVQCLPDPGDPECGGTRVTCADLACGDEHRACAEATTAADATCADCLGGFVESGGVCEPESTTAIPEVETSEVEVTTVGAVTAVLAGRIAMLGSPAATEHGFCVGPTADPGVGDTGVVCSTLGPPTAVGPFDEAVVGLSAATTYHVRAYATTTAGTGYGADRTFTTVDAVCGDGAVTGAEECDRTVPDGTTCAGLGFDAGIVSCSSTCTVDSSGCQRLPVVVTSAVAPGTIRATGALLEGALTSSGVPAATVRGFCVGTDGDPSVTDGACSVLAGGAPVGAFTENRGDLLGHTRYHVRAYATNAAGTAYGVDREFETPSLGLGLPCSSDVECASGLCPDDAADPANHRCAPRELATAGGGAMEFRYVPATGSGGFLQGSPTSETGREGDESQWRSTITRAYFASRTEVTQGQWKAATSGVNPSYFQTPGCVWGACASTENANDSAPVELVDWWSAVAYTNWLSEQAGESPCYTFTPLGWDDTVSNWADGDGTNGVPALAVSWSGPACSGYRLPTESEWEWSARGPVATGTLTSAFYWGATASNSYLWYSGNSGGRTRAVGTRLANSYGLRDASGNVWEWVWDWYAGYPSSGSDYLGPANGTDRLARGSGWDGDALAARSADRGGAGPGGRGAVLGFRVVRTVP
ncbi:MAG: SUMF1/EgtB/PvdO family nonheme iron enzyme [Myxococcales bacterium]|nr:SUMF1/EgtB/PvdO family nonheme iron enzyme [Myxococcales bacterium]